MTDLRRLLDGLPVTDHHVHLRPDGRGVEAVEEFARYGGTRILLVHAPYPDLPPSRGEGFAAPYHRTLATARRVRAATEVQVLVALGPHPAELGPLTDRFGRREAVEVMETGLAQAQAHVQEGEAVALGEIGRPHFPVDEAAWEASNRILASGMALAREADCPVILHTEAPSPALYADLAARADAAGLPRDRVVKHFADAVVGREETRGIFPSVVVKGDRAERAARTGTRFLMETDYLDDPRRPGAVLGPATVPRRTAHLLRDGVLDAEGVRRVHEENVRSLYGATAGP